MAIVIEVKSKLKEIIDIGKSGKNFGNGRFIRNILEKARVKQASRLVQNQLLKTCEIDYLKPEDFELPAKESGRIKPIIYYYIIL